MKVKSLSHARRLAIPWTAAYQAPPPLSKSQQMLAIWSPVPLSFYFYLFLTNWSSRNRSKPKQLWRSVARKQRGERDLISLHLGSLLIDLGFPGGSEVKAPASNAGDPGSIPWSGRSPGEGNGNPLQYSCLENPMDGEAW